MLSNRRFFFVGLSLVGCFCLSAAGCSSDGASRSVGDAKASLASGLDGLASPDVSLAEFKAALVDLTPDSLKGVASSLADGIKSQEGVVDGLKAQLRNLTGADADALEQKLSDSRALLDGLREKLAAVVDTLQKSGIDVSQFTGLLRG